MKNRKDAEDFPSVEMIPLDRMIKNDAAQRPFDPAWAKHLATNFDRRLVGVLEVNALPNGYYAVGDGWHRRHALLANGFVKGPCHVHHDQTEQDQAGLFIGFNTRRNVRYIDDFFARVTRGDTAPVAIVNACEVAGWKTTRGGTADGAISAMKSLEQVWKLRKADDESLGLVADTLRTITEAWGYGADSVNGQLLQGIGLVLARYSREIDLRGLANKLAKYEGGAAGLIGKARGLRAVYKSTGPNCVAEIVVNVYNSGRTSRRIPDWRR